jgi:alpha-1,3-rhamnosyl/mannosyltransferase
LVPEAPAPVVVPLAPDPVFRPVRDAGTWLAARGLEPDGFWLGAGFAAAYRNLDRLLDAYARVRPAVPLVIVGRAVSARGRVDPRVRQLGMVEDEELAALYSSCRLFARPARYEGFGLPLVEAMACGAPCVSSGAGSLAEVGGDAVRYFDPAEVDECAAQLAAVDADAALRDTLRAKSLARAAAFSWDATARATLAVYRAALGGAA